MNKENLLFFIKNKDKQINEKLFQKANSLTESILGKKVYFRGIIEFSNYCEKNCFYCGLRKENKKIYRYKMAFKEIIKTAIWAYKNRYGSIVLQSGEITSRNHIEDVLKIIKTIKLKTNNNLGITLSLGELPKEAYLEMFKAGAHRYLLRIETSNEELYKKLHPKDHKFKNRLLCLEHLKSIGYQTGTGVMIGLPFQFEEDLVKDLLFFKKIDIDMIGMGPYISNEDTPFKNLKPFSSCQKNFELSLKMIALARLLLKDINIAATTALQALHPKGRELALQSGANILMPVITEKAYRKHYLLYKNKPCIDDTKEQCKQCIKKRILSVGKEVGENKLGDSLHFFKRISALK